MNRILQASDSELDLLDWFLKASLTYALVVWDVTANFSLGPQCGFIDQERDVDNMTIESTAGLIYFAPVLTPALPKFNGHADT